MENDDKCAKCKQRDVATVPFYVFEGVAYRFERSQKVLIIVTVIALILSIAIIIGAIMVLKLLSDVVSVCEAKEVVQNLADTAGI